VAESAQQDHKLNVFISYSRDDLAFADQLRAALKGYGFSVTIDREDIPGGDAWRRRLNALIRDADTVVFVLSPSSARAPMCAWEVTESAVLGKRIIPIVCCPIEDVTPPPELAELNYIYFYSGPKSPGSGFGTGLVELASALNTDLDWLREHTRYLRLAKEWEEVGKPSDRRLLSAPDIALAKAWAARRPAKAPELTALQLDFIGASEAENKRQQSAEAQRLREVAESDRRAKEAAEDAANKLQFQLTRANRALAESINSDLGSELHKPLSARARNALWKLAYADEPVKCAFVSILAGSPEETARASPNFSHIFRALGLLRPASTEAERLLLAVVEGLKNRHGTANTAALVEELKALVSKISNVRASQALDQLLKQIGQTTDPFALQALAQALQALAGKLSEAQAGQAVEALLKQIDRNGHAPQALQALAGKLSEAQAGQAVKALLKQIDRNGHVPQALQALAGKLSEAQAGQAVKALLKQIGQNSHTTDSEALEVLAQGLQALAGKLSEAQAGQAVEALLKQMGQMTNPYAVQVLPQALQALAGNLGEAQAAQALDPLLKQIGRIGQTDNPFALVPLPQALQALAGKLSKAQAAQALDPLLKQIGQTTDSFALLELARTLQALAGKLSEAQAGQALDPLLKQIGRTTDSFALLELARTLQALAGKLSETQAGQALDPLLKQIGRTTDPLALRVLAQALQALPGKLSEAQAVQASKAAASSLAWAATEYEAVEWAQALVVLSHRAADQDGKLAAAIAYPTAAGPATEVLLDAIRAGHPEAPAKEKGTEAALKWLADTYPSVLGPPVCPQPLQPDLKCPGQGQGSPPR
jgi:hypothetical protein